MSIHITSPVLKQFRGRTPLEKLVLVILSDYAGEEGDNIFPSIRTVAERAGCSVEHARKVVKGLVERGVLEVVRQGAGGDPRNTTEYRIVVEALAQTPGTAPGTAPGIDPGNLPEQTTGQTPETIGQTPRAHNGGHEETPRAHNGGPPAPTTGDPRCVEPEPPFPSTDNPSGTTSDPPPEPRGGKTPVGDRCHPEAAGAEVVVENSPAEEEGGRNPAYAEALAFLRLEPNLGTMNESLRRRVAAMAGVTAEGLGAVVAEWRRERSGGRSPGKGALIERIKAYAESAEVVRQRAEAEREKRQRAAQEATDRIRAERAAAEQRRRAEIDAWLREHPEDGHLDEAAILRRVEAAGWGRALAGWPQRAERVLRRNQLQERAMTIVTNNRPLAGFEAEVEALVAVMRRELASVLPEMAEEQQLCSAGAPELVARGGAT